MASSEHRGQLQQQDILRRQSISHHLQVTSFGGSGTTMLLQFFASQQLPIPSEHDSGVWKHLPSPPTPSRYVLPSDFRAVYLVSDPVGALLSLFRRGVHMAHAVRMQSERNWPDSFLLRDEPNPPWGLRDFVSLGRDCFGLTDQFHAWTGCEHSKRGYPIALVRYEFLWEHLADLFSFVGLPVSRIKLFPARRNRSINSVATSQDINALSDIYGDLCKRMNSLPPFSVY
ncbi:MAG: hypothetical protein VKI81_12080 [Synechococcaceae cyanobacterium]|nr:hypothetical protein [Synechococcaceae cyanobacterium]